MPTAQLEQVAGTKVRLSTTVKSGFVAPEDRVLCGIDYSSQELYVAAVLSQDETMLGAFRAPEKLPLLGPDNQPLHDQDGKQILYKNPQADLHTLTTKGCCYPELFTGKPESEWVAIAKNEKLITAKGCGRDYAKKVNFG